MRLHARSQMQSIQLLRAVAALLVVFYHIESRHPDTLWHTAYTTLFERGHIGVDIFFVLSGFLVVLTRPHAGGAWPATRFLMRRFLRIWPAYALVTLIYGIWITQSSSQQLIRSLLFLPQTSDPALVLGFPTLFVGWTLNYEAWFYLSCAALLLLPPRAFPWLLAGWAIISLLVLPALYSVPVNRPPLETPPTAYPVLYLALVSNPIIWEFVAGAAFALLFERMPIPRWMTLRVARTLAIAAITLFIVLYFVLDNKMEPLACGLPALLMLAALVNLERIQPLRLPFAIVMLGNISYGIYLCHPIWLALLRQQAELSPAHELFTALLVVLLTLVSAILLHYLIERPAQQLARSWTHRRQQG